MERVIIKDTSKELVHCIIGIRAGWRHEPPGRRGITHFLEHGIFLGNEEYPNPDEVAHRYGVEINGITLPEHTLFYFTSLKEDYPRILQCLLSIIFHPDLEEEKLEEEKKKAILTAIVQESDYTPWELAYAWGENLVFNWDFKLSLGREEDLVPMGTRELREWHSKYYHQENCFMLIFGDVKDREIDNIIAKARIKSDGEIPSPFLIPWKEKEVKIKKDTVNVEMVYGFKITEFDVSLELVSQLFGSCHGMLEEWDTAFDKYVYVKETKMKWNLKEGGLFFYFGATSHGNAMRIDEMFWDILNNVKITPERVELAKKLSLIEALKMKEGGERGLFRFFHRNPRLYSGGFKEYVEKLNRVTLEDIIKAKDKHLIPDNCFKAFVGDV